MKVALPCPPRKVPYSIPLRLGQVPSLSPPNTIVKRKHRVQDSHASVVKDAASRTPGDFAVHFGYRLRHNRTVHVIGHERGLVKGGEGCLEDAVSDETSMAGQAVSDCYDGRYCGGDGRGREKPRHLDKGGRGR